MCSCALLGGLSASWVVRLVSSLWAPLLRSRRCENVFTCIVRGPLSASWVVRGHLTVGSTLCEQRLRTELEAAADDNGMARSALARDAGTQAHICLTALFGRTDRQTDTPTDIDTLLEIFPSHGSDRPFSLTGDVWRLVKGKVMISRVLFARCSEG
jgi:hypothetical protein